MEVERQLRNDGAAPLETLGLVPVRLVGCLVPTTLLHPLMQPKVRLPAHASRTGSRFRSLLMEVAVE